MGIKKITRRQFVTKVSAGTGGLILTNKLLSMTPGASVSPLDPYLLVNLGKSGLKVPLLGMGTGYSGYNRSSNITRAGNARDLIRQAYDKGIRFFDCADSYGTHPYVAEALKDVPRESYILGTKIWVGQGGLPEPERPDANLVIDRFLKELNTDYIDLVQIHCMTDGKWTDKQKRQMDLLENLKSKNIIKAHGASVHSLEAMEACAESDWVDVVHVRINPYGEAMDSSDPAEVIPVIEKLHGSGKGVIGMKLVGNGKFKNDPEKIETSLKYVLGLGTVDMILVGFELPEQIDNYLGRIKAVASDRKIS
ncbi:MAG TPA: aldo/keto reductase [Bacteroidales bacterium]|nr:aldo/keto reductase [Bacteroidales bacterium]